MEKGKTERAAAIRETAGRYATEDLGRKVQVMAILDHGDEALVLCGTQDDGGSFSLLLSRGRLGFYEGDGRGWLVVSENDVEDFSRNAHQDGRFEEARLAALLLDEDEGPEPEGGR